MNTIPLFQAGAHRGGREYRRALVRSGQADRIADIVIADPKPNRATREAEEYSRMGLRTLALQESCESAVRQVDDERPIVALVDEVAPMAHLIEHRTRQPVLVQGVGRGPSLNGSTSPAFGMTLASFPERAQERGPATELLQTLARLSPPASSQAISRDPLNAMRLHRVRRNTSEVTAHRVLELDRTREQDDLQALLWGEGTYPLVLARGQGRDALEAQSQALDLVPRRPHVAVAIFSRNPDRVDIFVLDPTTRRDGHFVRMHVPFHAPAPAPQQMGRRIIDVSPSPVSLPARRPRPPRAGTPVPRSAIRAAFTD